MWRSIPLVFSRAVAGWLAVLVVGGLALPAAAEERPNLIFCMTDDQGYGDVGYMGHEVLQTPVLDEMAASGLRFDRFYAAAPVCSPTRASVLTGRHPNRTGTFTWGNALRPQERTLAALLREAGYRTGFFGKWHLGSVQADGDTSPGARGFDRWTAASNFYMDDPWMSRDGEAVQLHGEGSAVTVAEALPFIREATQQGEPFVVFIWFGSPHTPHQATEELQALYPDQPDQRRNYYGEISGIDQAMGTLRDELRELGIEEQTLLWFTSDNGGRRQDGAEHPGLRGEKGQLWEGGIRVPAIAEWPGWIQPGVTNVAASTVDILPTFLQLAGVSIPDDRPLDGVSLTPLLAGEMAERPRPLGFWVYGEGQGRPMRSDAIVSRLHALQQAGDEGEVNAGRLYGPDLPYESAEERPGPAAWIEGDWKLHRRGERHLLFNLAEDEGEQRNVIDDHPDRATRMREALHAWETSVIQSMRGDDY